MASRGLPTPGIEHDSTANTIIRLVGVDMSSNPNSNVGFYDARSYDVSSNPNVNFNTLVVISRVGNGPGFSGRVRAGFGL